MSFGGGGFAGFGAPAAAPSTFAGFPKPVGAAAPTQGGFPFGAAPNASTAGFGAPAAAVAPTSSAFTLGAPPAVAATSTAGFGFGPTATNTPTSTGFALGAPPAVATSAAGFGGFGAAATSAAPGLNFGAPAAKTAAPGTGFGFGAATTAAPTLNFGAQPAAATTAAGGFGAFGAAATTSAAAPGLGGFGAPAAATAAPTSAAPLGFGAPAAATASTVGLGGTAAPAFGLTPAASSAATATTTAIQGLGGTANPAAAGGGQGAQDGKGGAKTVKETPVPQPLQQHIEDFKKFVKEERGVSSDIAHVSSKTHAQIRRDIDGLSGLVKALGHGLAKNRAQLDWLKVSAAQELLNVEVAQRTRDTPPAMQYENVAPLEYFARLVANFEGQMLLYRRQIEETEQHLNSASGRQSVSPEDVMKAIQRLQASFTNLAGRYQKIHEAVKQQKEQYIHLHRQKYGTTTDLFARPQSNVLKSVSVPTTTIGPSPFSTGPPDPWAMARANVSNRGMVQQQQPAPLQLQPGAPPAYGLGSTPASSVGIFGAPQQPALAQTATVSFNTTAAPGLLGSTMSPFGGNQSSLLTTGGKRGKH